jgi:Flp pilus assembly protein TadG
VLLLGALFFTALLGFAALVIDGGQLMVARRRMQNAVDAGAHAGVQVLPDDVSDAKASGRAWAVKNGATSGEITSATVSTTYVTNETLTITGKRSVSYVLAGVLPGSPMSAPVSATASAVVGSVVGAAGVMPFGLEDENGPGTPGFGYTFSQAVTIKEPPGNQHHLGPGNYGLLALDGRGGSTLRDTISQGGSSTFYTIGDKVYTEPGQTAGPVRQGLDEWASSNHDSMSSSCNDWSGSHTYTDGKLGITPRCKYRVVLIPIIDDWPNGRGEVTILGFAQMYIMGFDDSQKEVEAVFLDDSYNHPNIKWGKLDQFGTRIVKLLH